MRGLQKTNTGWIQVCLGLHPLSGIKLIFLISRNFESFGTETPFSKRLERSQSAKGCGAIGLAQLENEFCLVRCNSGGTMQFLAGVLGESPSIRRLGEDGVTSHLPEIQVPPRSQTIGRPPRTCNCKDNVSKGQFAGTRAICGIPQLRVAGTRPSLMPTPIKRSLHSARYYLGRKTKPHALYRQARSGCRVRSAGSAHKH